MPGAIGSHFGLNRHAEKKKITQTIQRFALDYLSSIRLVQEKQSKELLRYLLKMSSILKGLTLIHMELSL